MIGSRIHVPSLKLTVFRTWKWMVGILFPFLLGPSLFSWAFAVSFRECIFSSWWFFPTHLKNMLVKLDHLPRVSGWKFQKYVSCHHLATRSMLIYSQYFTIHFFGIFGPLGCIWHKFSSSIEISSLITRPIQFTCSGWRTWSTATRWCSSCCPGNQMEFLRGFMVFFSWVAELVAYTGNSLE